MIASSPFADGPENESMPRATVIPVLQYRDVATAAAWLCEVFAFTERLRIGSHRIQMNVGSGAVVIAARPHAGPAPSGQSIMVRVRDADEIFRRASGAGAEILQVPESFPYGERQFTVRDIGGHVWTFSQSISDTPPASWGGALVSPETPGEA